MWGVLSAKVCVGDLALRRNLAGEGQDALGVGQDGAPILLVAGIHSAAEDARVDLGEQIEGILPRVDPIEFPIGSLDEAVHRHHQRGDDLSHVRRPFTGNSRAGLPVERDRLVSASTNSRTRLREIDSVPLTAHTARWSAERWALAHRATADTSRSLV
jgi:hypothetical protein